MVMESLDARTIVLGQEMQPGMKLKDIDELVCAGTSSYDVQLALHVCRQLLPEAHCKGMVVDCDVEEKTGLQEKEAPSGDSVVAEAARTLARSDGKQCLSAREHQVAKLTAEGLTCKEIAWKLGVRESTVATHRRNIYRKTGLACTSQLAVWVVRSEIS